MSIEALNQEKGELIEQLYAQPGATVYGVGRAIGICKNRVTSVLAMRGVKRRGNARPTGRTPRTQRFIEEVCKAKEKGRSYAEIARITGYSESHIRNMHKLGLDERRAKEGAA